MRGDRHRPTDALEPPAGRPRERIDPVLGLRYSPDPADYVPKCRNCHVWRDQYLRTGDGPRLVWIAGWILGAIEDAGGRIATRDVYRMGQAAGIDARMLTAARTGYTDVQSDRRTWWLREMAETGAL